jgi:hypothetical protein
MANPVNRISFLVIALGIFGLPGPAAAKDELPDVTVDGLKRVETKNIDALYLADGATLEPYKRVYLVDCAVAFRKDWKRDYNMDRRDLSRRVDDKDMQRIQDALSKEFRTVFTRELERGGYEITTELASDVLILRPALVNLDVTAPDVMTPGISYTVVRSAGAMTLYLEMYDAGTNAKIATVVDGRADPDSGIAERANRTSNKAAADRILRHWADRLVKALDAAHGKDKD